MSFNNFSGGFGQPLPTFQYRLSDNASNVNVYQFVALLEFYLVVYSRLNLIMCSELCYCNFPGSGISRRFEFGRTHVVRPKGKHQATIVWLQAGPSSWRLFPFQILSGSVQLLLLDQWLYLADFPAQLINEYKVLTRFPTGFDVGDIAEEAPDDLDGLDAFSSTYCKSLVNRAR
ncbi:lysophospholipase [Sarracenia purpurea var. burkii]